MQLATSSTLLILSFSISPSANCQALDRAHASLQRLIVSPTNAWQEEAREPKTGPTAQKDIAIRAARDAYMDKIFGLGIPIEQLEEKHLSYKFPNVPFAIGSSEIPPAFPGESVIVGSFDAFDTVLSKAHQTIYEEIHISVDRTLYPEESSLSGSVADILVPGGTVILNGKTVSYHTAPQEYGLTPGSCYVLFLQKIQNGDFYLLEDSISLVDGSAHPNSPAATEAVTGGKWAFAGLPESALLKRLSTDLKSQHQ